MQCENIDIRYALDCQTVLKDEAIHVRKFQGFSQKRADRGPFQEQQPGRSRPGLQPQLQIRSLRLQLSVITSEFLATEGTFEAWVDHARLRRVELRKLLRVWVLPVLDVRRDEAVVDLCRTRSRRARTCGIG